MPFIIPHPGIPGALQVIKTPSEPTAGGTIGVSVALDKTVLKGTVSSPGTIAVTVTTTASVSSITPSISPVDSEITIGTVTGSGTNWLFDVTVAKTAMLSFSRAVTVSVTNGSEVGVGSAPFTVDNAKPNAPSHLNANGQTRAIELTWNPPPDPDVLYYNVYYNTAATPTDGSVKTFLGIALGTIFDNVNLTPATQRWYWVTAVDRAGNESDVSGQATAVAQGDIKLDLALLKNRVGANGTIDVALTTDTNIDASWVLTSLSPTDSHVTIGALSPPTGTGVKNFTFTVTVAGEPSGINVVRTLVCQLDTSLSGGKTGAASASFLVDTQGPGAPTGLIATSKIQSAYLQWTPPTDDDIASYLIYRNTINSIPSFSYGASIDASFLDSAMDSNTSYYYWVKAVDLVGNVGTASASVNTTTLQVIGTDVQQAAISIVKLSDFRTPIIVAGAFTDNSPSAGSVSWSGIQITKLGTTYSIADGSTSNLMIWWAPFDLFFRGDTRATFDATFNENLGVGHTLIGQNQGGVFHQTWDTTVVRSAAIYTGSVVAEKIAAGAVTATKLAVVSAAWDPSQFTTSSGTVSWSGANLVKGGVKYGPYTGSYSTDGVIWWDASANLIKGSVRSGTKPPLAGSFDADFIPTDDVLLGIFTAGVFKEQWSGTAINGDQILTGSIEAAKIDVNVLSAISADIGTISAGIIEDSTSYKGIRLSTAYGIPTNWGSDLGYFLDLAQTNGTFLKAGTSLHIDVGSNAGATFSGTVAADALSAGSAMIAGTARISGELAAKRFTVQTAGDTIADPMSPALVYEAESFMAFVGAMTSTITSNTANVGSMSVLTDTARYLGTDQLSGATLEFLDGFGATLSTHTVSSNTNNTVTLADTTPLRTTGTTYRVTRAPSFKWALYSANSSGSIDTYTDNSWSSSSINAIRGSAGTTAGSATLSGDSITDGGGITADNGNYTVSFEQQLYNGGMTITGSVIVTGSVDVYYRTSGGGSFTYLTTTTLTDSYSGSSVTGNSLTQTTGATATGIGSGYVEFKLIPSVTISNGATISGASVSTVIPTNVTWTRNPIGGASDRRNLRLHPTWNGSNFAPHVSLSPIEAQPSNSLGRKGDVIFANAALQFHDGSTWIACGGTSVSDIRLKTNVETIPDALEMVRKLRGVTFNWANGKSDLLQHGVIAQEVEEVLPDLIYTNLDGRKSVDYARLTSVLIEAIKELDRR